MDNTKRCTSSTSTAAFFGSEVSKASKPRLILLLLLSLPLLSVSMVTAWDVSE